MRGWNGRAPNWRRKPTYAFVAPRSTRFCSGTFTCSSGELYFHDNRYRVARGDLNFANPFRLDPVINVEATTNIQQYEITLNFSGQSSKLSLSYRSDPPLPANDIITLLALGQTSSESALRTGGTTQTGTTGASALLSEAISSQLGGRVERLFGITRFRVDPGLNGVTATGSGQNATARITVEQQVTRNLTVLYESNVNSTQQQVIQVEYIVNRNVSVVALARSERHVRYGRQIQETPAVSVRRPRYFKTNSPFFDRRSRLLLILLLCGLLREHPAQGAAAGIAVRV